MMADGFRWNKTQNENENNKGEAERLFHGCLGLGVDEEVKMGGLVGVI